MRSGRRTLLLIGAATLLVAVLPAVGAAQSEGDSSGKRPRLSGELVELRDASRGRSNDTVEVEVTALSWASSDAVAAIEAAGGTVEVTYGEYAAGMVPIANLDVLGDNTEVRWAQRPAIPFPEGTIGEGPGFMGVDAWQEKGFTGRGQVVAVIDAGFGDLTVAQGADEVPDTGDITQIGAQAMKKDLCGPGGFDGPAASVHGTAVAEVVHETAPDADLLLICIDSSADFGAALNFAQANGARVVSVSLGFFNTGRGDGTGSLRFWPNKALNRGILWVNSNGNYAQRHWHGTLTDANGDGWHDTIWTFSASSSAKLYLKWDDWPDSDCNLDLQVCRTADCTGVSDPVAESTNPQGGTEPPTEEISLTSIGLFYLRIVKKSCSGAPRIDLFIPSQSAQGLHPVTSSSSVTGLVPHRLVHSVGAVDWDDGLIESYSSRGPTINGDIVPDTSAPSGVTNLTYGTFGGTSAAAPHVAGAAALILQAYPSLTVEELDAKLKDFTLDQGETGPDNDYGWGSVLFPAAPKLEKCFGRNPTLTGSIGDDYLEGTDGPDVILARNGDDIVVGLGNNDRICGGGGTDTLYGDLGNDIMSGGAGRDWVWGGPGHDRLYGDGANDQMRGGSGRDRMWGGLGNDKLVGNGGNDTLYGEGGNDRLEGSGGNDTLVGNKGTDTGRGSKGYDSCNTEIQISCE